MQEHDPKTSTHQNSLWNPHKSNWIFGQKVLTLILCAYLENYRSHYYYIHFIFHLVAKRDQDSVFLYYFLDEKMNLKRRCIFESLQQKMIKKKNTTIGIEWTCFYRFSPDLFLCLSLVCSNIIYSDLWSLQSDSKCFWTDFWYLEIRRNGFK